MKQQKQPTKVGNFYLQSRHQTQWDRTAYLMAGNRHQFTQSLSWARSFRTLEEAAQVAAKIGGLFVVEVTK